MIGNSFDDSWAGTPIHVAVSAIRERNRAGSRYHGARLSIREHADENTVADLIEVLAHQWPADLHAEPTVELTMTRRDTDPEHPCDYGSAHATLTLKTARALRDLLDETIIRLELAAVRETTA